MSQLPRETLESVLDVSSCMFSIGDPETTPVPGASNALAGLLVPSDDGEAVIVLTGVHTGNVTVTARVWDHVPDPELADWEDAAESVMPAPVSGSVTIVGPMGLLGSITVAVPSGQLLVRCVARGREEGASAEGASAEASDEPIEEYLLDIAPAGPGQQPRELKATSRLAREAPLPVSEVPGSEPLPEIDADTWNALYVGEDVIDTPDGPGHVDHSIPIEVEGGGPLVSLVQIDGGEDVLTEEMLAEIEENLSSAPGCELRVGDDLLEASRRCREEASAADESAP